MGWQKESPPLPFQSTLDMSWPQTAMEAQCFYEAYSLFDFPAETASSHAPLRDGFSEDTSVL